MESSNWNEQTVFLHALAIPEHERAAYLEQACPTPKHRARIVELLKHHALANDDFPFPASDDTRTAAPGSLQFDEFKVVHKIGEGGMGVVYLAMDTILNRQVALKVLAPHLTGSASALGRFHDEARSAAALKHPGIISVYRFGMASGSHYLVSEYVDGKTLADVIANERSNRLDTTTTQDVRPWWNRAAEIMAAVSDALDVAHKANIVHCDVKPANILIESDGRPRLTDFGIAKHLSEAAQAQTSVIGSCHYMSPEQASIAGARIDQRSDVFSLGVVLYELLTLAKPFEGRDVAQVLRAVKELEPLSVRKRDRRIPRDLETICGKAMEKEPHRRYQTAGHVAAELRCFLADRPILASPPTMRTRLRRIIRLHKSHIAVATIALLLGATGLMASWLHRIGQNELAWLSVTSEAADCEVFAQLTDPRTLESGAQRLLGKTPADNLRLPVGQYRITLFDPGTQAFLEFNWIARSPGEDAKTLIVGRRHQEGISRPATPAGVLEGQFAQPGSAGSEDMVLVEGADYIIGWSNVEGQFAKRRTVRVASFLIDKYEVSNGAYKGFIDATGNRPPAHWRAYGYDESLAERPVIGVTLEEAEAFARWQGKRLPTAIEWQAAARGADGRDYPWGNDWSANSVPIEVSAADLSALLSWDDREIYDAYRTSVGQVKAPDAYPSPLGVLHMFDGVRELTGTLDSQQFNHCVMGRSWADPPRRSSLGNARLGPVAKSSYFAGFRCARSARPPRP